MSITFLTLPTELRLKILKLCLPRDLATHIPFTCKTLYTESNDNEIWNQWLIKPVFLNENEFGAPKAEFEDHLDNIKEKARPLHPCGSLYAELLAIAESSTLNWRQKLKQFKEEALKNPDAGCLILLYPTLWKMIVSLNNYDSKECISYIANTSQEAGCLFFKTKALVNYVLTDVFGNHWIEKIANNSPETAAVFFEEEDLLNCVLHYPLLAESRVFEMARKAPDAFFGNKQAVKFIRDYPPGEKWIDELERELAAQAKIHPGP